MIMIQRKVGIHDGYLQNNFNEKTLRELLQQISEKPDRREMGYAQQAAAALLFDLEESTAKLLQIIRSAVLPENKNAMDYLERAYEHFSETLQQDEEQILFTISDLFEEAWLLKDLHEWELNIEFKTQYENLKDFHIKREEQIVAFLKTLAEIPYRDEWLIVVSDDRIRETFPEHLRDDLFCERDGRLVLNITGNVWRRLSFLLMGRWWDDLVEANPKGEVSPEETEHWFYAWELLYECWEPERYAKHKHELFSCALQKLEESQQERNWEAFSNALDKRIILEYDKLWKNRAAAKVREIPENASDFFLDTTRSCDTRIRFMMSFRRLRAVLFLCLRLYNVADNREKQRLLSCMRNPYILTELILDGPVRADILTDMTENVGLYPIACFLILDMLKEFEKKYSWSGKTYSSKALQMLCGILEEHLACETGERDAWLQASLEVLNYFSQKGGLYRKTRWISDPFFQTAHQEWLTWQVRMAETSDEMRKAMAAYLGNRVKHAARFDDAVEYLRIEWSYREPDLDKSFELLLECLQRVWTNLMDFLGISDEFWLEPFWVDVMERVLSSEKMMGQFLRFFDAERFVSYIEEKKQSSPILRIGPPVLIWLFLLSIPIRQKQKISVQKRERLEAVFCDALVAVQNPTCDVFSVENMGLLDLEGLVSACIAAAALVEEKRRKRLLECFCQQPPEKLLILQQYVTETDFRRQFWQMIVQKSENAFNKTVAFFPTMQRVIERLIEVEAEFHSDELAQKARTMLDTFEKRIEERKLRNENGYGAWIDATRTKILFLEKKEAEVLALPDTSANRFYKALIYLNRKDVKSLKLAEKMNAEELTVSPDCLPAMLNQFVSCVRIVTNEQASELERLSYRKRVADAEEKIQKIAELDLDGRRVFWSNALFLHAWEKDMEGFWKLTCRMPSDMKYDSSCAEYILGMLAEGKSWDQAAEYLDELQKRNGDLEKIREFREMLAMKQMKQPEQVMTGERNLEWLMQAINELKNLTELECARVRLQDVYTENPEEWNLLEMVADAVEKMQQYSDYLLVDGKTASEDAYSKFVQILFEQRMKEPWDFYVKDQSQEGSTGKTLKNGRQGVGRLDFSVYHKNRQVSIIEAIKVENQIKQREDWEHIRKIAGYRYGNCSTVFYLIFADTEEPQKLWENCLKQLEKLQEQLQENDWRIIEIKKGEELDGVRLGTVCRLPYLCRSEHVCEKTGQRFCMYHMMVDIRKQAAKQEAADARRKERDR